MNPLLWLIGVAVAAYFILMSVGAAWAVFVSDERAARAERKKRGEKEPGWFHKSDGSPDVAAYVLLTVIVTVLVIIILSPYYDLF